MFCVVGEMMNIVRTILKVSGQDRSFPKDQRIWLRNNFVLS